MNNLITVSVIIPAYNEEKYIRSCLDSIVNQLIPPDEVIVVNNNSTDRTSQILKEYPTVRIVNETKQGLIYARDTGFNTASCDILARCDADTVVPLDWVKKIKKTFNDSPVDALTGPLIYAEIKDSVFGSILYTDMLQKRMKFIPLIGPNMIIKRTTWNKIKADVCRDPTAVHEDIDLGIHIWAIGGITIFDKSLVAASSERRIKNQFGSFFIEYPLRLVKTIRRHADVSITHGKVLRHSNIFDLFLLGMLLVLMLFVALYCFTIKHIRDLLYRS